MANYGTPWNKGKGRAVECSHTDRPHAGRGLCQSCYDNWRYYYGPKRIEQRRARTLGRYGITPDQYDAIYYKQGGGCAICGRPAPREGNRWERLHVDHDHNSGRVRGLLCMNCNQGLGNFKDSAELLKSAVEYLAMDG